MKKFALSVLIILAFNIPVLANDNEMIEDYMDIVSNDCILGDYRDAVIYLDKVIKLAPNNPEYPKLKELLYQLGTRHQTSFITGYNADLDKAMAYKRHGDRLNEGNVLKTSAKGTNFWVYSYLGDYYRENKEYTQAIDAYFTAYQIEPSFTQALLAIANCYLESGQYELVNEPIKRFLYYNQQSDVAYAIRAKAYYALSQLVDAETEIVTAIALNDDDVYQLLYGQILYKRGNYNKAIGVLSKLAENIKTSDVFKYLGLSYLGKKEYSNAMLNLDKAIILSNDDPELNQKYNEIKEIIRQTNSEKLQNETRNEVRGIYGEKNVSDEE